MQSPRDGKEEDLCEYLPNDADETPLILCLRSEMKGLLARAIEELPEKERQVLALYYYEELTMKEVGAVLGVGESRVSQIHSMAVVRLRARLSELTNGLRRTTMFAASSRSLKEKPTMDKVLDQQEIDAMVRVARGGEAAGKPATVTVWDVRKAGQIGSEQMRSINTLHEGFARDLSHSLGAYLRIAFQAALVSAEHMTYREFLKAIPESVYLASCKLLPVGAIALFQLDLALAFPLIDVLLGGEGLSTSAPREITEIEEQILETVMRIICRELQNAWQALALEFEFEQRQPPDQIQTLLPSEEKSPLSQL